VEILFIAVAFAKAIKRLKRKARPLWSRPNLIKKPMPFYEKHRFCILMEVVFLDFEFGVFFPNFHFAGFAIEFEFVF
jgi:hypothetical protein